MIDPDKLTFNQPLYRVFDLKPAPDVCYLKAIWKDHNTWYIAVFRSAVKAYEILQLVDILDRAERRIKDRREA